MRSTKMFFQNKKEKSLKDKKNRKKREIRLFVSRELKKESKNFAFK